MNFLKNLDSDMFNQDFYWWPHFEIVGIRQAFTVFPVIFMAFGFQYNFFPVINVLENPNEKRVMKSSLYGLTFPLIFYFFVSFLGYSVYKTNTKSNFLLSFTADDIGFFLYTIVYLSFIGAEVMTFPIFFFEARNLFLFFIDILIGKRELFDESPYKENIDSTKKELTIEPFRGDQYLYIILLFIAIIFLGAKAPSVDIVFGVIGATSGSIISLILPGLQYIKLMTDQIKQGYSEDVSPFLMVVAAISIVFGTVVSIISLVFMTNIAWDHKSSL